jgi:hypothetical protein
MAISDRVEEAITKLLVKDYENAIVQIAIALDSTSKRAYGGNKVGVRFRRFITENEEFIIYVALGCGPRFYYEGEAKEKGAFRFGTRGTLANVIYKYVRNSLLHEGDLSADVVLKEGAVMGHEGDKFILGSEMIMGLLLSVIGAPVNAHERLSKACTFSRGGANLPLEELWGKLDAIKKAIDFLKKPSIKTNAVNARASLD